MSHPSDPRAKLPDAPPADNERLKGESHYLEGSISNDLVDGLSGGFRGDNFQLIRFHGMYEQDDRDIRAERVAQKLEPLKNVMLRCRLPGGIIQPKQWLGIDQFAGAQTLYGSIRLTNRQTFQFHGVLKDHIKPMHQWLNELGLDSIATAGDVNRNVLCTSNPVESSLHREAYEWAKKISEHLLPKTLAYAEIWLDGEKLHSTEQFAEAAPLKESVKSGDATEPVLGKNYLPRKFKTTVVIPPHNDVDLHANDLNFVAIEEHGRLAGFNVLVGGGLSMEHGNHATYPNTAREFGFIGLDKVLDCAAAVVSVQRDWGDRSNRKAAKTRYTLERVGTKTFIEEVENRMGAEFQPIRPYQFTSRGDRIGWVQGEDGRWHLTLFIENGRILDYPGRALKTGMREIAQVHQGDFRLTANQNLIVANVPEAQKAKSSKSPAPTASSAMPFPRNVKTRWPACPTPPAPWPWPKPSAFCRNLPTKSMPCLPNTALQKNTSCCASPAAPTAAAAPCWPKSAWWAKRWGVTTCTPAATAKAPAFRACFKKTSPKQKSCRFSTAGLPIGRHTAKPAKASAIFPCAQAL